MDKVLLTGGSGFIGSHIAEYFLQNKVPIKCLVRETSDVSFLNSIGAELCYGDINEISSLDKHMEDVDVLIHTAAKSCDWGSFDDFFKTNVLATLNVLQACKDNNIKFVIITGSISSYGEEDNHAMKNENNPMKSHYNYFADSVFPSAMNYYRDTKALSTKASIYFAKKNNLNLTIIEPAWVYGEREFNSGFFEYVKAVKKGMKFVPGSLNNNFSVIYAQDLAEAYFQVYKKQLNGIYKFIVSNPETVKLNDIHSLFCESAGIKIPHLLPKIFVYPIGFLLELIYTIFNSNKPPILSRSRINMMYDNIEFSSSKIKKLLNFEAKTKLKNGIEKTVRWYIENRYL